MSRSNMETITVIETSIPKILDLNNYEDWSCWVKNYLLAEDLWDVVEGTNQSPENEDSTEYNAWRKKNAKALCTIQSSCGEDTYQLVKWSETTAEIAWDTLKRKLGPKSFFQKFERSDFRSVLEVCRTTTDCEAGPKDAVKLEEGQGNREHESDADDKQKSFVKCVKSKHWDDAKTYLNDRKAKIDFLHFVVSKDYRVPMWFGEMLDSMEKEDLEEKKIVGGFGRTAFYVLVGKHPEMVEVAQSMVNKNPTLPTILPASIFGGYLSAHANPLPVLSAQMSKKGGEMALYLYSVTPHDSLSVRDAASLISCGFENGRLGKMFNEFQTSRLDIAWDLIRRYPNLVMAQDINGKTPLTILGSLPSAYLNRSRLRFWEKWIYDGIHIPDIDNRPIKVKLSENGDSDDQRLFSDNKYNPRHLNVPGIKSIYQMKLMHHRINNEFLPHMCQVTKHIDRNGEEFQLLKRALFRAAELGFEEYITHLFKANEKEEFICITNEKGQSVFQFAVECRQLKVFNLLHGYRQFFPKFEDLTDNSGNNILHTVASISSLSLSNINNIRGTALQMQSEVQWFKEVKRVTNLKDHEDVNKDHMTPHEVFVNNHKKLAKEAEKSMKETATSCTVVGALIVTIMFAATFTVPGGNNGDTGLPTFLTRKVFTTFVVSDAISLFSSITSVIMFLGILTSRYTEDDFHKSLPKKMIIGLFALFLSIATMMIAFSCTLYIMLDGQAFIVVLSILLGCVPVTSFIWMQFPLLRDIVISTLCGPRMFSSRTEEMFEI